MKKQSRTLTTLGKQVGKNNFTLTHELQHTA